jgi:ATP-dependent DNA helicase RecG
MTELERFPLFAFLEEKTPTILLTEDELYNLADAALIKEIKEDKRIERKPIGIHANHLGDYLCMWSNTPPNGGLIAVGIEDKGELSGCLKKEVEHINNLESAGMIYCPDAKYDYKHIPFKHSDGREDFLILFRVRYVENKVVKNNKGDAFVRRGDRKKQLTNDEVRELEIDKGQMSFENEPCSLHYPVEFDTQLIADFAGMYRRQREPYFDYTDEDVLVNCHLGKMQNKRFIPNNACAIVFAKDPCSIIAGCRIRFLRFEGEEEGTGDRWNAQKDVWIDYGSIPHQIREAERVIESQLRTFTRLGKDNKFHSTPEYPKYAWYEALVNACVHRSYSIRNMNIFVKMFDDRIEIESPGGFPPMVNAENIYETHHPRNPNLFDAMYYLGFVRGVREGTRRMRESMLQMELPSPEFTQQKSNHHSVTVRLRNDYKQRKVWLDSDAVAVVGEAIFNTLSQDEKRAINFVAENGSISVSNLQRITQRTWPSAKKLLQGLCQKGILRTSRRRGLERDTAARFFLNKG